MKTILQFALIFLSSLVIVAGCGVGGGDDILTDDTPLEDTTETYSFKDVTVNGDKLSGKLVSLTSTEGSGYILFSVDSEKVFWETYENGGIPITNIIWTSVLLKFPVGQGQTWSDADAVITVTDVSATVTVPAGTFSGCVVSTETVSSENTGNYIVKYTRYFAPGVGLIKIHDTWKDGSTTVAELQGYQVNDPDPTDLFPISTDNRWTYKWVNQ